MKRNTVAYKSKQFLMFAGPALILFCMVIIVPFIYGLYLNAGLKMTKLETHLKRH